MRTRIIVGKAAPFVTWSFGLLVVGGFLFAVGASQTNSYSGDGQALQVAGALALIAGLISGLVGIGTLVSNIDKIAEAAAARHNADLDAEAAAGAGAEDEP